MQPARAGRYPTERQEKGKMKDWCDRRNIRGFAVDLQTPRGAPIDLCLLCWRGFGRTRRSLPSVVVAANPSESCSRRCSNAHATLAAYTCVLHALAFRRLPRVRRPLVLARNRFRVHQTFKNRLDRRSPGVASACSPWLTRKTESPAQTHHHVYLDNHVTASTKMRSYQCRICLHSSSSSPGPE